MANTLTGLYPILYTALDVVSRELVGLIAAVSRDATTEQAAVNQTVRSPVVPAMSAATITPTNIAASGTDQTINYVDVVIENQRKVSFNLTGEEERGLGANNMPIAVGRFAQAMRTLTNEIETDLAELYVFSSRAYGTAGTTPFNTADDLTDLTEALRILDENGAPSSDRHIVLGSAAVAKLLGKQPSLFRVNEAGSAMSRRFGMLEPLFNASFHHSGQIQTHTPGAGTTASPNYAVLAPSSHAIGSKIITLDTGSGQIKNGDLISFGDGRKYVVATGRTGAGEIILAEPGLRATLANRVVPTFSSTAWAANMVFTRDAFHLAARVPAVPSGGDQADDRIYVQDPVSGLTFEISVYRQYRQVTYEVAIAWGVKAVKPAHAALLIG
jgi:hypothetical protein